MFVLEPPRELLALPTLIAMLDFHVMPTYAEPNQMVPLLEQPHAPQTTIVSTTKDAMELPVFLISPSLLAATSPTSLETFLSAYLEKNQQLEFVSIKLMLEQALISPAPMLLPVPTPTPTLPQLLNPLLAPAQSTTPEQHSVLSETECPPTNPTLLL
jgi:hypothetical protein